MATYDLTRNEHDQFTFHALIRITERLVRVAFTSMLIEITGSELVLINLHDTRCAGRGEESRVGTSHRDEVKVAVPTGHPESHRTATGLSMGRVKCIMKAPGTAGLGFNRFGPFRAPVRVDSHLSPTDVKHGSCQMHHDGHFRFTGFRHSECGHPSVDDFRFDCSCDVKRCRPRAVAGRDDHLRTRPVQQKWPL
jgi:hypothetical protein